MKPVRRVEVFTGAGHHRECSDETRAAIIEESYSGAESISAVARRHALAPSQLLTWRREYRRAAEAGGAGTVAVTPKPLFVPAVIDLQSAPTAVERTPMREQEKERRYSSAPGDWRSDVVRAVAWRSDPKLDLLLKYAKQFRDGEALVTAYARECLFAGKAAHIIPLGREPLNKAQAREVVTAFCLEGLTPDGAQLPTELAAHPLGRAFGALSGLDVPAEAPLYLEALLGKRDYDERFTGMRAGGSCARSCGR